MTVRKKEASTEWYRSIYEYEPSVDDYYRAIQEKAKDTMPTQPERFSHIPKQRDQQEEQFTDIPSQPEQTQPDASESIPAWARTLIDGQNQLRHEQSIAFQQLSARMSMLEHQIVMIREFLASDNGQVSVSNI